MTAEDNKKIDGPNPQAPPQPQAEPQVQTQPQAPAQAPPKKGCFNLRNCCLGCLTIFIIFIILILILLTLSGLVRIPLLSPLLYGNGPKPLRVVTLQSVDEKYFENQFKAASDSNQTQIIFNENILSYFINNFANKENNILVAPDKQTKGSQIAVENGYAEIFYKPLRPKTALTIKIIPASSGYKAQKIKIGKLRVPVFAANLFFSRFLDFNAVYSNSGIKSIRLERSQIVIDIDPTFFKNEQNEAPVPFVPQ